MTIGWSQTWQGPLVSASYDTGLQLLYVVFATQQVSAFSGVPLGVIQSFSRTKNPMSYYLSFVQPAYHALVLSSSSSCPLLAQSGVYLWAD